MRAWRAHERVGAQTATRAGRTVAVWRWALSRRAGEARARPIRENVGFTLAKVCKGHRGRVGAGLAPLGLHVGQEMVLAELWDEDGLRGGELAARLGVEPPTVTKMLRRLEGCSLVIRRQDPEDARSFRVYLTGEGRSLEGPVCRLWGDVDEQAFAGMSAGERRTLHRLLTRVRANVDPAFVGEQHDLES